MCLAHIQHRFTVRPSLSCTTQTVSQFLKIGLRNPMLLQKSRMSLVAILFLVSLRLVIGWHFYMEGSTKVREGGFSSTGFLSAAKGPLAKNFQALIADFDGEVRTDSKQMNELYDNFATEASELYGFSSDDQKAKVSEVVKRQKDLLNAVYSDWKPQLEEFRNGRSRVMNMQTDNMRNNVASLRKQKDEIETKWRALARPALADIDKITNELEANINAIATDAQRGEGQKYLVFKLPNAPPVDVRLVDKIIPIFDMSVGILLILGLLTPLAALAAGIFLASVVLTQFPGAPGAQPTYYQSIEMVACFLLAFTDAGRYAGLDFIPWSFWNRNKNVED